MQIQQEATVGTEPTDFNGHRTGVLVFLRRETLNFHAQASIVAETLQRYCYHMFRRDVHLNLFVAQRKQDQDPADITVKGCNASESESCGSIVTSMYVSSNSIEGREYGVSNSGRVMCKDGQEIEICLQDAMQCSHFVAILQWYID